MIAMQYKITLPSDYPMDSIKNRILDKGHLLNGFPGLVFKAYLYSEKSASEYNNIVNSYANLIYNIVNSYATFACSSSLQELYI